MNESAAKRPAAATTAKLRSAASRAQQAHGEDAEPAAQRDQRRLGPEHERRGRSSRAPASTTPGARSAGQRRCLSPSAGLWPPLPGQTDDRERGDQARRWRAPAAATTPAPRGRSRAARGASRRRPTWIWCRSSRNPQAAKDTTSPTTAATTRRTRTSPPCGVSPPAVPAPGKGAPADAAAGGPCPASAGTAQAPAPTAAPARSPARAAAPPASRRARRAPPRRRRSAPSGSRELRRGRG